MSLRWHRRRLSFFFFTVFFCVLLATILATNQDLVVAWSMVCHALTACWGASLLLLVASQGIVGYAFCLEITVPSTSQVGGAWHFLKGREGDWQCFTTLNDPLTSMLNDSFISFMAWASTGVAWELQGDSISSWLLRSPGVSHPGAPG